MKVIIVMVLLNQSSMPFDLSDLNAIIKQNDVHFDVIKGQLWC